MAAASVAQALAIGVVVASVDESVDGGGEVTKLDADWADAGVMAVDVLVGAEARSSVSRHGRNSAPEQQ